MRRKKCGWLFKKNGDDVIAQKGMKSSTSEAT
jgi:hypothetical protein